MAQATANQKEFNKKATAMPDISFSVPKPDGRLEIELKDGQSLFILGRNGTGKSALIHHLASQSYQIASGGVVYLPGSRPSYFESDSLSMTANSRSHFAAHSQGWDSSPDTRIRPIGGTSRNERAIFDLQSAEVQYRVEAANEIEIQGASSPAIARLQAKGSPLDRVNRLLTQANFSIQTKIIDGELKALHGKNVYSISKMSDGERTALIFISDVIAAKPRSIFLVDEPELHLHRAIITPLISALISERPDCNFIISTHELSLATSQATSPIVLVRGCEWAGASVALWDVDLLPDSDRIPEDLRIDLLGSRQKILFVEGTEASRDYPIYAILFPEASIRHRNSCIDVRKAVNGLRQIEEFHHARAFGLVDGDGMSEQFSEKLKSEFVFPLAIHSVESLYYSPEAIASVAQRQAATLSEDSEALVARAHAKALLSLKRDGVAEHLASRVAERILRDQILEKIPNRQDMVASEDEELTISVKSPYPEILIHLRSLIDSGDLDAIVARFPIRESGLLSDIAAELRFKGTSDYEKAVLTVLASEKNLLDALLAKLGGLADSIQSN